MDIFLAEAPSGVVFLNESTTIASHGIGLLGVIIELKYRIRKL